MTIADKDHFGQLCFVKTFNIFSENAVGRLNIKKSINSPEIKSTTFLDPIDICTVKHKDHTGKQIICKPIYLFQK